MRYVSTRGGAARVPFSAALMQGIASDGGLYVPEQWPSFDSRAAPDALPQFAATLLAPFVADDPLADQLAAIPQTRSHFLHRSTTLIAIPRRSWSCSTGRQRHSRISAHDFWRRAKRASLAMTARGRCTSWSPRRVTPAAPSPRRFMAGRVCKSACFIRRAWCRRHKSVSSHAGAAMCPRFSVHGAFDDCQRLVKEAFVDEALRAKFALSSANSINVARLLPQMTYFAATSLAIWNERGEPASFVIPSGNLGHATACVWARKLGLPIDQIVLAHNANRTMPTISRPVNGARATIPTLASAMDVGDPSNGERLRHLYPDLADLRGAVTAYVVDDEAIRARIRTGWERHAQIWCPHTAAAAEAFAQHTVGGAAGRWVIVATAHPAKFPEIVEPIIGQPIPLPPALSALPPAGAPTE